MGAAGIGVALALVLCPLETLAGEPFTITGMAGRDVFDDGPYGAGVVICGLAGGDRVTELAGATFRGGRGWDHARTLTDGRFVAGPGRNHVKTMSGGSFVGGGPWTLSPTWTASGSSAVPAGTRSRTASTARPRSTTPW